MGEGQGNFLAVRFTGKLTGTEYYEARRSRVLASDCTDSRLVAISAGSTAAGSGELTPMFSGAR